MAVYTFHHYEGDAPAGITFGEFPHDAAAMEEAQRLLEWHALTGIDVCDYRREVGAVRREGQAQQRAGA